MRNLSPFLGVVLVTLAACASPPVSGSPSTHSSDAGQRVAASASSAAGPMASRNAPVQLTVDPCVLVTASEAATAVGATLTKALNTDHTVCSYVGAGAKGTFAVVLQSPDFCKLLVLALDQNMFGTVQVRRDDVGDGGMQVLGHGNVQFLSHGGCVEVEGSTATGHIADPVILQLAKTAAGRVTG